MDKADEILDEGDRYARRLLNRSHSHSYRRRRRQMEALNKSSVTSSTDQRCDGNPFEMEFSGANKAAAGSSSGTAALADDDQLEMTYVSTWPGDNDDQSTRTFDVEPQDSLSCVKSSLDDGGNCSSLSSSRQFRQDIDDGDGESIAALTNPRHGKKLSLEERFGSLTSNELSMQNMLNLQYDSEFAQCSARMQLQGPDEFFGVRVFEICEPMIVKFHRKSCDSKPVGSQSREPELTYIVKEDTNETWLETNLEAPPNFPPPSIPTEICAPDATYVKENKGAGSKKSGSITDPTTASLTSEDMRSVDREIDELQQECDDNKTAREGEKVTGRFEIVGAKDNVDGGDDCGRNYVFTTGRPIDRSSVENFNGSRNPTSPKDATFSQSPSSARQPNLSRTASFLKRHTSFLFKNLRTPKLMRRKSNVESTKKTIGSPRSQVDDSTLTRSNTVGSSDNERRTSQFKEQIKQVQANLPPDMDNTLMSEMENFLKVALESGKYNSTMAQTNLELQDHTNSISSNNATLSESRNDKSTRKTKGELTKQSGTLNRTMSIYKTLTQKIRDKFRKYDHTDGSLDVSNLDHQKALPEGLDPGLQETIKQLLDKVNVQDTIIYQTSKALHLCDSMPEFIVSPERVEYERLLLLAVLTKNAVLREIDRIINQKAKKKSEEYTYTERGEVTLKDIRLQLREDVIRREHQNGDVVEWFVVLVAQGPTVWATHAIACPIASPQIYFPGVHTIAGLTPDFRLSIKVYSMKLQHLQVFNHEDKYHITRSCTLGFAGNKMKTLRRKSVSPKHLKFKCNMAKETSFVFCGGVELKLYDLKLPSPWPLDSLASNSVLQGTVDLNFSCKLELSMFHAGFLTHCEETGDLAWNRRWCQLEGHKLMFWNCPREQEFKPPIYVIDLVNCASASVEIVDRRLCPKPRTLLLETKRLERELIVVEGDYNQSVTRHLLSYDNHNELTEWHSKLNHVISALCDWSVIQTQ